jgi:hypothetical protein
VDLFPIAKCSLLIYIYLCLDRSYHLDCTAVLTTQRIVLNTSNNGTDPKFSHLILFPDCSLFHIYHTLGYALSPTLSCPGIRPKAKVSCGPCLCPRHTLPQTKVPCLALPSGPLIVITSHQTAAPCTHIIPSNNYCGWGQSCCKYGLISPPILPVKHVSANKK